MQIEFIAFVVIGIIFTIFSLLTLESDLQTGSTRQMFILGIAIVAWLFTIFASAAVTYTTTTTSPYNVITYNSQYFSTANVVNVVAYPQINQTKAENSPISASSFYAWLPFGAGLVTLNGFLMFLYLTKRGERMFQEAKDEG